MPLESFIETKQSSSSSSSEKLVYQKKKKKNSLNVGGQNTAQKYKGRKKKERCAQKRNDIGKEPTQMIVMKKTVYGSTEQRCQKFQKNMIR